MLVVGWAQLSVRRWRPTPTSNWSQRSTSRAAGTTVGPVDVVADLRAFADAECDVVVDFTVADAARVTLPWLAMHGIHAVVGTTGLTDDDLDDVRSAFGDGSAHCLLAPELRDLAPC